MMDDKYYGLIQSITVAHCRNLSDGLFRGPHVEKFLRELVPTIGMVVAPIEDAYTEWEDHSPDIEEFKRGVSANIFIETSNISVHACDPQKTIRVCIFTCKDHNWDDAVKFCESFWGGLATEVWVREVL